MNIHCIGTDHRQARVEERERLAFTPKGVEKVLCGLKPLFQGVVLLSTCNRTEFYIATEKSAEETETVLRNFLELEELLLYRISHSTCVRHLFEVCAGLKSMVVGETEIFGQVKTAYETACHAGTTDKFLHKLFQHAFSSAKDARRQTRITHGNVSVASVAVELAESVFENFDQRSVLILGAGETGEASARHFRKRGIHSIFVANRTHERAEELARELNGEALYWEQWKEWIHRADIMIASTSAPHHVLHRDMLLDRPNQPLFLIDLSVPRNVEPRCAELPGVHLYNIDDLQLVSKKNLNARKDEIAVCQNILRQHQSKLLQWMKTNSISSSPTVALTET